MQPIVLHRDFVAAFMAFVAILIVAHPANAQDDASSKSSQIPNADAIQLELGALCSDFFRSLQNNQIEQAYQKLLRNSPISSKREDVFKLRDQTEKATILYGPIRGHEKVNHEFVSSSMARMRFLSLHDNYPLRWIFTFYKQPKGGWIVVNIKFDDDPEYLFKVE